MTFLPPDNNPEITQNHQSQPTYEDRIPKLTELLAAVALNFNAPQFSDSQQSKQGMKKASENLFEIADEAIFMAEEIAATSSDTVIIIDDIMQKANPNYQLLPLYSDRMSKLNALLATVALRNDEPSSMTSHQPKAVEKKVSAVLFDIAEEAIFIAEDITASIPSPKAMIDVIDAEESKRYTDERLQSIPLPSSHPQIELAEDKEQLPVEEIVFEAVSTVLLKNKKPVITIREIMDVGFNGYAPKDEYQRAIAALKMDTRIEYIGTGDYKIVRRSTNKDWTNVDELSALVDRSMVHALAHRYEKFILDHMLAHWIDDRIKTFLTAEEKVKIMELFSQHDEVIGTNNGKVTLKPVRAIDPSVNKSVDKQMTRAGIHNTTRHSPSNDANKYT